MAITEISNNYTGYAANYTNNITSERAENCAKESVKVNKYDEQRFLSELSNKHPQLNLISGRVNKNYNGGQYPSKVDVVIAPNILAKMAQDSEAANKYGKMLADIPGCEKWANSMIKSMTGNEVKYRQVWIDENGNMGSFSISGPSEKQERIDRERKEKEQEDFEGRLKKIKEKRKTRTAADELAYLSEKFDGYSFVSKNYTQGMKYGTSSTTNVALSPSFLAKMANNSELEAEYLKEIGNMQDLDKQFAMGQAARGWKVVDQGWAIDKDGEISSWAITTKDSKTKSFLQKMSEKSDEIRQKQLEKAKAEKKASDDTQKSIDLRL